MLLSSGTTGGTGDINGNIGGIPLSNNDNFFVAATQGHRSTTTDGNNGGGNDIGQLPIGRRYSSSSPKPRSMRTQRGEHHHSRPLTPRPSTPIVNYRNRNGAGNGVTRRSFA